MYLKFRIIVTIALFLPCILFSQNKARKYILEGNNKYNYQHYDEAAANYIRAIQEGEDSYKSNFNLGNAMFQQKKYNDAVLHYEKSIKFADNKIEASRAYLNIGNAFYKKKEYDKATEAFKKSLKLNPKDEKARYNYALAKQKLKEQEEKEQEDKEQKEGARQGKDKEGDNKKDDKSKGGKGQPENNQGESEGQNNKFGQGQGDKEDGDNSKKNQEKMAPDMKEEYYEGILDAMEEQEKRAQQKIINKRVPNTQNRQGKDW